MSSSSALASEIEREFDERGQPRNVTHNQNDPQESWRPNRKGKPGRN
jgi:hypothetical protein